jgi:hypothetical protein
MNTAMEYLVAETKTTKVIFDYVSRFTKVSQKCRSNREANEIMNFDSTSRKYGGDAMFDKLMKLVVIVDKLKLIEHPAFWFLIF